MKYVCPCGYVYDEELGDIEKEMFGLQKKILADMKIVR